MGGPLNGNLLSEICKQNDTETNNIINKMYKTYIKA
jgi:hypothetical protein